MAGHSGNAVPDIGAEWEQLPASRFRKRKILGKGYEKPVRGFEIDGHENNFRTAKGYGKKPYGKGFNAPENPFEMDGVGSVSADDIIRIAVDIENIIEPNTCRNGKKQRQEQEEEQQQKPRNRHKSLDEGMEL